MPLRSAASRSAVLPLAAATLLTAPVAVAQTSTGASSLAAPSWAPAVDAAVATAMRAPIEGLAIAVLRGGRVEFERAYGTADRASDRAATTGTVWEIGSITKTLTATAIHRLAAEGRLSLDDAVGTHLPALAARADGATLRHLLAHTSGLSSAWAVADLTAPTSVQVTIDSLAARPLDFAPGTRYAYNNNGYLLLGRIAEQASGQPYTAYVRGVLTAPLGLADIAPCSAFAPARRATGYTHPTRGTASPEPAAGHHPSLTFSAGILCATAGDLGRWMHALDTGRLLDTAAVARMATPTVLPSGRRVPYGLGLEMQTWEGERAIGHSGATAGFLGETFAVPGRDLRVVVLTNGVYAGQIVRRLAHAVLRAADGLPEPAVTDLATTAEERARYAGTYDLGPVQIEVYEQGDHLRAQSPGQVAARLLHQGDGVFRAEHDPALQLRFRIEDGRAAEVVVDQGGRALPPARRVR